MESNIDHQCYVSELKLLRLKLEAQSKHVEKKMAIGCNYLHHFYLKPDQIVGSNVVNQGEINDFQESDE